MSEEQQTTEQPTTEEKQDQGEVKKDRTVPVSAVQAKDKQIKELAARLDKFEKAERLRLEEEAKAKGNFEDLVKSKENQINELQSTLAQKEKMYLEMTARQKLMEKGCADVLRLDGLLKRLDGNVNIESIDDWVNKIAGEHPTAFEREPNPVSMPSVGQPAKVGSIPDLDKRLRSKDLHERSAAVAERQRLRKEGKIV